MSSHSSNGRWANARVLINRVRVSECRPRPDLAAARLARPAMMASGPYPQRPSYQSEPGHPHPTHVDRELLQNFGGFLRDTKSNARHRASHQPLLERHLVLRRRHKRMPRRKPRYTPRPFSSESSDWLASVPGCITDLDNWGRDEAVRPPFEFDHTESHRHNSRLSGLFWIA